MSNEDLAGAILAEHRTNYGARGWSCECGHNYGQPLNVEADVEVHRLLSVEAAVREQVAREIEASDDLAHGHITRMIRADAARIARGERP